MEHSKPCKKRHRSIFFKLLILLMVSWILMHIIFALFFHKAIKSHGNNVVHHIFINHANYLVKDIGVPFDSVKAKSILETLPLELVYIDSNQKWASNEKLLNNTDSWKFNTIDNKCKFRYGRIYLTLKKDNGTYLFRTDIKKSFKDFKWFALWKFFTILMIVFILLYFSIRKILAPIKSLILGVQKVSDGDYNYKIPVSSCDELSELAESFNSMTRKVNGVVKSKEQLLLDVSHELRSPLTRAKVALEFIDDKETKDSIVSDLSEMDTMIGEILESERLSNVHGKLNKEVWNIKEIITDISALYNKEKVLVSVDVLENLEVIVDRKRVLTVLKNIIENSLKYSDAEITPVEISIKDNDRSLEINIKDYGIGIPKEDISFVFEPFYRIDKSRSKKTGGYGLGMSLCKKIMEAHNGSIKIISEINKGTTIVLKFNKVEE